jgi:hypothetical protein
LEAEKDEHAPLPALSAEPLTGLSARELAGQRRAEVETVQIGDGLSADIFTLREAIIVGRSNPLVCLDPAKPATGIWESHLIRPNFDWNLQSHLSENPVPSELPVVRTPVLFLAGPGSENFYHWIHDSLPRLIAAEQSGRAFSVLVPASSEKTPFIRESLALLGIGKERIIEYSGTCRASSLLLVEDLFYKEPQNAHLRLLNGVRDRLLGAAAELGEIPPKSERIFLSREGGNTRTLTNQQEVEDLLLTEGFKKVRTETLSLADQIRIFASAGEIVAPHGAGLVHSLFLGGGRVTEFFPIHPEAHLDPAKRLVEPCWFRIIAAHESAGRRIAWNTINCDVEMLSDVDFSQYRLRVGAAELAATLRRPI